MKSIDVVIVNYNSTEHLLRCLKSLFETSDKVRLQVFVQDNASRDRVDQVTEWFPHVKLTKNAANLGFARAINNALGESTSRYVLILNPDTIVHDRFFESALQYMNHHPDVGILGPRILETDGAVQGSARAFPNLLTALFGRTSMLSRAFPNNPITRENILTARSDGVTPMEVDWVSGACMLVRRQAIQDVGFLDARFFMYWEDADWCRRMWQNKWKVVYFPCVSIMHYVGVSSEKNPLRSIVEFHRSIYYLFKKYADKPHSLLRPFIFWGLIYRLAFVLASQIFRRMLAPDGLPSLWDHEAVPGKPTAAHKIKVLRFIARLNVGGPSIHVYLLSTGLNSNRFESILVTGRISPQEGDMSYLFEGSSGIRPLIVQDLQREINPAKDLKAFFHILRILRRENPDIVHTHTAKAGTTGRIAVMVHNLLGRGDVHTVHTFHGHVFEGYFSPAKSLLFIMIERLLAKSTDVIIAISKTQKDDLSTRFRIAPSARIKTIPLGFDLRPYLESNELKGCFRRSLGLEEATFLVGIVGRLVPIKHHVMFLDAAGLFLKRNPGIKVKFVLVGDGELREMLTVYCEQKGLTEHVIFCGWRRDLPEVYADLDVLALTSLNEGTPVSIIEAMAASTPVIAADAGGVLDLLGPKDGGSASAGFVLCERGLLCKKGDAAGLAEGLTYLATRRSAEIEEMVERARSFVKKSFSADRLVNDVETLYLNLMNDKSSVECWQVAGWNRADCLS
jgi:GT2 family glycosyltransferase/glycosyltransferase involved in cell wall biosynthesis